MQYEIVTIEQKTVVGLRCRTSNADPNVGRDIGQLWARFFAQGMLGAVQHQTSGRCIGLYSNYESDARGAYDVTVCCEVSQAVELPTGAVCKTIPAGRYAKFVVRGDLVQAVGAFWSELWGMPLNRKYDCDFEEYQCSASDDGQDVEIHMYISLKQEDINMENMRFCQSCGMPMGETDELYGLNADASKSMDYCSFCYKDGAFTADVSMEQMIEICIPHMVEGGMSAEKANAMMREFFPALKRWRAK